MIISTYLTSRAFLSRPEEEALVTLWTHLTCKSNTPVGPSRTRREKHLVHLFPSRTNFSIGGGFPELPRARFVHCAGWRQQHLGRTRPANTPRIGNVRGTYSENNSSTRLDWYLVWTSPRTGTIIFSKVLN